MVGARTPQTCISAEVGRDSTSTILLTKRVFSAFRDSISSSRFSFSLACKVKIADTHVMNCQRRLSSQFCLTFSQHFKEKCISGAVTIGRIINFHPRELRKAFVILYDAIFLVRLQGKFEIDHSLWVKWLRWRQINQTQAAQDKTSNGGWAK